MVKIALVNPAKTSKVISAAAPPINLGYLASYIRKNVENVDVIIIDGLSGQNIENELIKFMPDIVGITSTTPTIFEAYRIADFVRSNLKSVIVMGGVHVSIMPEEALKHADIVVEGEGEVAFLEIVNNFSNGKKLEHGIMSRPYIKNLDDIPSPAWDLMDMEFYIKTKDNSAKSVPYTSTKARALTIITSRGCPYKCIFCHNSWKQTPVRYHSAKRLVEDIETLMEKYKIDSIMFADDEFIANGPRLKEICEMIKERGIDKKLVWGCQARADIINRFGLETIKMMKDAGCKLVAIGFESGSQKILDILKCNTVTVEDGAKAIKICKDAGIKVGGSFMMGTPTETLEDMLETLDFVNKNDLDFAGFGITTPYPGTRLWNWCVELNLLPNDVDYVNLHPHLKADNAYIVCNTMPKEKFIKEFNRISKKANEKVMYNYIYKTAYKNRGSFFWEIMRSFHKYPYYTASFPFRHPKEFFGLVKRIIVG